MNLHVMVIGLCMLKAACQLRMEYLSSAILEFLFSLPKLHNIPLLEQASSGASSGVNWVHQLYSDSSYCSMCNFTGLIFCCHQTFRSSVHSRVLCCRPFLGFELEYAQSLQLTSNALNRYKFSVRLGDQSKGIVV